MYDMEANVIKEISPLDIVMFHVAAPQVLQEHVVYQGINTWGENCELDYIMEVDTVTLDAMVRDNVLPVPDILSIDAQGAELRIMWGGGRCITESVLCIVSEIEFFEIYQGQDLFCAQIDFLSERGFRLADILNTQYWHPAPAAGIGFLTVGEALFFRDAEKYCSKFQNSASNVSLCKFMKLAATAYAFRRFSYSSKIVTFILENFGAEAKSLFLSHESFKPILDLQQYMQRNHDKYLKDNQFFIKKVGAKEAVRRSLVRKVIKGVTPPFIISLIRRIT